MVFVIQENNLQADKMFLGKMNGVNIVSTVKHILMQTVYLHVY